MTIEQLHSRLQELKISPDRYFLHGLYGSTDDNDKIALTIRKGKYTIEYETYFKERGEKHSSKVFFDEDEACDYVLNLLVKEEAFWNSRRANS